MIASTATADKNTLDTGTLGFSNIGNKADFKVEHQSVGISTGGNIGGQFVGNMANGLLVGANNEGHDNSTTHGAVSDGTITVRDTDKQQQNVADLSRDVEHANNALSPIFDKEKEQNRLREAQLIGEIGSQVSDVIRTQGDINGLKAAKEKLGPLKENATEKDRAEYMEKLRNSDVYKDEMKKNGTGSALQQGVQAATAAIQGLAGGDMAKALAGASAPYLAEVIHNMTTDANGKVNVEANLMAHAVLGAVMAQVNGNSALAGASGAVMGEYIAQQMYPGINREDLTEEQRQTISALGTLASGLAGGLAGGSTADAVAGAQAGKNALENNSLGLGAGDIGFWLGNPPDCDTTCKAGIAKGIAEGNLVVSAGIGAVAGGAMIVAATPEIAALAKAALKGCKAEPAICLNNVGLQVAEAVTPGGVGAAGVIGVGKTAVEATAARAVAANAAHNATSYAGLKIDLKTTQAANEVVDSLRNTGKLPSQYVVKQVAEDSGWTAGKALGNYVPGGQIGGDIFENTTHVLPSIQGRVWYEADVGLANTVSRAKQDGTRLLYSNDGLLYITTDHYKTVAPVGTWK
ncbi:TPA: VENN motif pre-toxin domain-containing protein [Yersinia enterocolitica]